MDTEPRSKTTVVSGSEMINLRVPLPQLRRLNDYATKLGISRSKLLLTGALQIIENTTMEENNMLTTE